MRTFVIIISVLSLISCKTKVESISPSENEPLEDIKNVLGECPEAGVCSVEIFKNKELSLLEDGTGALYPQLVDGDNIVVQFTYWVEGPAGTADGDYSETIHFVVDNSEESLTLKDEKLKEISLVFGKHCYCKGEAGYYSVEKGNIKIDKSAETLSFSLNFEMDHPTHKISTIVGTYTY